MIAYIDADIILYNCLFATKDLNFYAQLRACNNTIENILDSIEPNFYTLVLTGADNFRYKVDPNYKANRKDMPRPEYLYDAKQYLIKYWDAVLTNGYEADDYIAMNCTLDDVIVSTDKDFLQLGMPIYDRKNNEIFTPSNPWYYFCSQLLTGDPADNIPGVTNPSKLHHKTPPNFTVGTASALLDGLSVNDMKAAVTEVYMTVYGDDWFERFDTNARLLWLRRSEGDDYIKHW